MNREKLIVSLLSFLTVLNAMALNWETATGSDIVRENAAKEGGFSDAQLQNICKRLGDREIEFVNGEVVEVRRDGESGVVTILVEFSNPDARKYASTLCVEALLTGKMAELAKGLENGTKIPSIRGYLTYDKDFFCNIQLKNVSFTLPKSAKKSNAINLNKVTGADPIEAVKWYRKAAEQGNADAQNYLGVCYSKGEGVEKDQVKAVEWCRKAAEQGHANAQRNLGFCYANGKGVAEDMSEAVKWYRKAAEQGLREAQRDLARCYETGRGVPQDMPKAVDWYQKAAWKGDADAQFYLGKCYETGRGVTQDLAMAVEWYRKAEKHNEDARRALQRFEEHEVTVAGLTWTYKVNDEGSVVVIKCSQSTGFGRPDGAVTIPSALDGKPVTSIGKEVFWLCSGLTSVTIPNSVTNIGERAFSNSGLRSVMIPNSVITIGKRAFNSCSGLTSVTIGNHVMSIGENVFSSCDRLTSIAIPESVTNIGKQAFSDSGLTSVTIPTSVAHIGNEAFSGCNALTSIKIPDSVTSIGEGAFAFCRRLSSVTIPQGVTSIGDDAFSSCGLTSVVLPTSVTNIGKGAFSLCGRLSSVTIPQGVTHIGDDAFLGCGLTSVVLPSSVTYLGGDAFDRNTTIIREKMDNSSSGNSSSDNSSLLDVSWSFWIVIISFALIVIGVFLGWRKGMLRLGRFGRTPSAHKTNEAQPIQTVSSLSDNQEYDNGGEHKLDQPVLGVSRTKVGPYEEHPNWKSFRGRMSVGDYLMFTILILPLIGSGAVWGSLFIVFFINPALVGYMLIVDFSLLAYVRLAASVRRFHDLGLSGWGVLGLFCISGAILIGIRTFYQAFMVGKEPWLWFGFWAGVLSLLEMLFLLLPGTRGANMFGPDPKGRLNSKTGDLASLAQTNKKLKELVKMRDSGIISESEYEEKRAQILSGG